MLLEKVEETIAKMNTLKTMGVRFSLDDFGTGYSSLQYLKRLPISQLKIDQSFVREIVTNGGDKAIVRTIIAMANSFKLDVIAEGVETEEQQQLLMGKGCTHYQGYLFGKPLPIEQFEALLKPGTLK
jgi:EAL domain-containing protein (putative c-di-GMP-specific phosphodiesterase class I)